ncbi:MAG: hypothetical protein BJ554DRAFT_6430 [Olpidium bornovanus]|uniref:NAD-dependent epimerase/dehydratase domain-containing protein n=1 Tax=Olpidium bornovanus TaxID=278681 RepID=A0A8H7ZY76_9FUNG|nr:MAG: hypothetical protein BJ554DRAFT_6430 [Olpidium bornovanus]
MENNLINITLPLLDNSFGNSTEFTMNNVLGTHLVLETSRVYGIRRLIHISTDEVYGEVHHAATDACEESILAPTNPYAATKAAAEMMVLAYYASFNVPAIITRSNNVYGPYQFPEKVIPKFINLLASRKKWYVPGMCLSSSPSAPKICAVNSSPFPPPVPADESLKPFVDYENLKF